MRLSRDRRDKGATERRTEASLVKLRARGWDSLSLLGPACSDLWISSKTLATVLAGQPRRLPRAVLELWLSTRCAVAAGARGTWLPFRDGRFRNWAAVSSASLSLFHSPPTTHCALRTTHYAAPTTHLQSVLQCVLQWCTRAVLCGRGAPRSVSLAAGLGHTTPPDQPAEPGFLGPIMPPRTPGS